MAENISHPVIQLEEKLPVFQLLCSAQTETQLSSEQPWLHSPSYPQTPQLSPAFFLAKKESNYSSQN